MGIPPVVRVPEPEPFRCCCYIDGGAQGIVAPYVETVDQILNLIGAVKLRPLKGGRLAECLAAVRAAHASMSDDERKGGAGGDGSDGGGGGGGGGNLYDLVEPVLGKELTDHIADKNKDLALFINIESQPALDRLDELLSVPGLDGVFVGPADLSVSLGHPREWHHPDFHAACSRIVRAARRHGLGVGNHYSFPRAKEYQKKWMSEGANIVIHLSDVVAFRDTMKADLAELRAAAGIAPAKEAKAGGETC